MKKKKVYFIGIAGKTMGTLAKAFRDMGWQVSGSDHKGVYPPISTYLKEHDISYTEGYREENVPRDANLVIVGRSALMVEENNPEYLTAKKIGCPVLSYPEALRDFLIKKNSIVIAGTYGKTTISALISLILIKAGLNPSYMIGGVPLNLNDGIKITDSLYSVVEGDESPALFETDPPKFLFYRPRYLLITATKHDHPEIYKTKESYLNAFIDLVKLLPKDGLLVYNFDSVDSKVIQISPARAVSYSLNNSKADYFVNQIKRTGEETIFNINNARISTSLLGRHNLENICAAYCFSREIGIDEKHILEGIKIFRGIKTRLEFLGKIGERFFYWDFAQHPEKVKSSLEALREHYHRARIICVFDPAATALKYKESLNWYPRAFDSADQIIVGKVGFLKNIAKEKRVSGSDIVKAISKTNKNVFYEPIDEKLIDYLLTKTKPGDVIIFMSSGGLRFVNLINKTTDSFKINY